ncbi:HET-domain-containing protein, partial [Podospora aff. communis PSN243]
MERHTAEANINTPVAASPHVYRAVQEHEFTRILLLHPSADRDSPLRCDLTHCTATNFLCEAISYAWGPPDLTASLFCGPENAEIRITPSLESALRAFRLPSETRRLWADAVCINQHDLDEKIVQVRRMSTIYRRAQHVRVWLGDEADDSNEAMRLFHLHEAKLIWLGDQILAKPPGDLQLGGVVEESDPWYTKNLDNVEIADEVRSLFSRRGEVAVRKLLARPWFGRRWVIQEVGLAQQASIHCGGASMDSKRLIACADVLEVVYRLHEPVVSTVVASILDGLRALHAAVRAGCLAKKPLVEWMDKFYASQCSDDRDRVYALMGLGGDTEGRLADAQHGLASLRYQSRVEQVYAALAVHTLKKHRKVGMAFLLSVATSFQSRDLPGSNVPTWVPDW